MSYVYAYVCAHVIWGIGKVVLYTHNYHCWHWLESILRTLSIVLSHSVTEHYNGFYTVSRPGPHWLDISPKETKIWWVTMNKIGMYLTLNFISTYHFHLIFAYCLCIVFECKSVGAYYC